MRQSKIDEMFSKSGLMRDSESQIIAEYCLTDFVFQLKQYI